MSETMSMQVMVNGVFKSVVLKKLTPELLLRNRKNLKMACIDAETMELKMLPDNLPANTEAPQDHRISCAYNR